MRSAALAASLLACVAALAQPFDAGVPRLGKPIGAADAARADPTVFTDGSGLPPGSGDAVQGQALFAARCADCHVEGAGTAGKLIGREPLAGLPPHERTIGQYWPYATTLFGYIRRAMPFDAPGSLRDDEAYALTAYLLHANGIVGARDVIDATTLPRVRMPNRDGFLRLER